MSAASAAAEMVRDASERSIRAEAYRLVSQRTDVIRTLSLDQRAAELLALAEYVAAEHSDADALARALLPHLAVVADPAACFDSLVEAVRDRDRFREDPRGFALDMDFPSNERALDSLEQSVCVDVDAAIWSLLYTRPACRRCMQQRPSNRWAAADMPRSSFCEAHQGGRS